MVGHFVDCKKYESQNYPCQQSALSGSTELTDLLNQVISPKSHPIEESNGQEEDDDCAKNFIAHLTSGIVPNVCAT